ncbi:MAG: hypothetical protein ACJA0I_000020 [Gammaproteobacteria bacterium]|jgi:hypothetical protein|uniref:hypothetical protein n=1 Tax=Thalassolituus sp. UBA3500 TaxID=1947664 RepID=UPI000C0EC31A|nr:hypothetical protein [Thalassolituus sp. UBA3500]MBN58031.1 hypothetical protein [Oceanospirillaceae bacterium]|tara:strand:+ start:91 stop:540 length:450 start_codon:yes stop_codon:yes gene_type:complete
MDDQREQIKQLFIGMPFALLRWVTLADGNTLDRATKVTFVTVISREPHKTVIGSSWQEVNPEVGDGLLGSDAEDLSALFQAFVGISEVIAGDKESGEGLRKALFDFAYDLALELAELPKEASDSELPDIQRLCLHALLDLFALSENVTE